MCEWRRYGVSQQLGKFTVAVDDQAGIASVTLVADSFTARLSCEPASATPHRDVHGTWQEWVARVAVRQCVTIRNASGGGYHARQLDAGGCPWKGDLLTDPYGGATDGIYLCLEREMARLRRPDQAASRAAPQQAGFVARPRPDPNGWTTDSAVAPGELAGRDRRQNRGLEELIEKGIQQQGSSGDRAALDFLTRSGVPHHTLLRVLACAAFRRLPAKSNRRAAGESPEHLWTADKRRG